MQILKMSFNKITKNKNGKLINFDDESEPNRFVTEQ